MLVASRRREGASGLAFPCKVVPLYFWVRSDPSRGMASCSVGKLLPGRKAGPWTDRASSALAHKLQPMVAIICPGEQIQSEVLPSKMLLRVELPISALPAEG